MTFSTWILVFNLLLLSVKLIHVESMSISSNSETSKCTTYYNYFAFGSNMASPTMTALRNLNPITSTAAVLPAHRLAFNVPGTPFVEPSWASVEPVENEKALRDGPMCRNNVHGVLYKLTEEDFQAVCNTEGVPFGYTLHRCRVIPYRGNGDVAGEDALNNYLAAVQQEGNIKTEKRGCKNLSNLQKSKSIFAYTLRAPREELRKAEDIPPSRAYLNVLIRGAEEYKLDREYLQFLKDITPGTTLVGDGMAEMMLEAAERRKGVDLTRK
jgi:hypothetical protein